MGGIEVFLAFGAICIKMAVRAANPRNTPWGRGRVRSGAEHGCFKVLVDMAAFSAVFFCVVIFFLVAAAISYHVGAESRGRLYGVNDVPPQPVAVVFGAGVRPDGSLAPVLADRVRIAAELYHAGKVRKLLLSGDNSVVHYDEPTAMRAYAIELGVKTQDLHLDYAGFRTYDTCYRARAVFGVRQAVLVTQRYHLERALYTCRELGIDVVGVPADRQRYQRYFFYLVREQLSRLRAFVQVQLHPLPRFLGPLEAIDSAPASEIQPHSP